MGKIMSYTEYLGTQVPENAASIELVGEELVFSYNGKKEKVSLDSADSEDTSHFSNNVKEAVQRIGAKQVHALDEFMRSFLIPGTDGSVDPKKSFIVNALSQLFRKQKKHKTVWDVLSGDAEDEGNRIRN